MRISAETFKWGSFDSERLAISSPPRLDVSKFTSEEAKERRTAAKSVGAVAGTWVSAATLPRRLLVFCSRV